MRRPLAREYPKGGGGTGRTLLLPHRRIPRVCKGTTLSVAQTGDIVLVTAEVLRRRSVGGRSFEGEPLASADHAFSGVCTYFTLYEQNWVLITDQITSSLCMI